MPYKAIIFDFDDTLVQTKEIRYKAAIYTAKHFYNFELTNSTIDQYWGLPFRELIKALFKDIDSFENISKNYKSIIHLFPLKRYDDALITLEVLGGKYVLGLITASTRDLVRNGFKDVGLSQDIFDYIQTSEQYDFHKPDPKVFDPIKIYFKEKRINTNEVLYIGDSLDDFISAKNAGIDFLGIARNPQRIIEFKENKAEYVESLSQVLKYLEKHD